MNFNPPFYEVHKLDKEQVLKLGVGKTSIFLSAKMPLTQCESPPFRGIWQSWVGFCDPLSHNPVPGFKHSPVMFSCRGCFPPLGETGSEKGLYDLFLSTRVLWPSLSTVCSVLPASSGGAKDLAARHGFHFRVIVVFSCVSLHRRNQLHCRNPACSSQQIPKYLVYSVFVPGIC